MEEQGRFEFDGDIDAGFKRDLEERPQIYAKLRELALQVHGRGWKQYSVDALFHRVRWYFHFETLDGEDFKMNNNYTSRYARKLMQENPQLEGFFELRKLKS